MNEKFSAGPWKYKALTNGWDGVGDLVGGTICKLVENNPNNAYLIAAAPELYSAIDEFVAMFLDTKKYPDPETITTGLRIFLPKAQSILKKARGE